MTFLDRILDQPSYGYSRDGAFYRPTHREITAEFFRRLNVFRDRKNWLQLLGWTATLSLSIPLAIFLTQYFSWTLMALGFVYGMVAMGSHGTFWLHRYSTHRAFRFRNAWIRNVCRNLVIKILAEEVYVISHHVHHQFPERAGDPYNVHGGWLYCFLADVNHQALNRDLNPRDYEAAGKLLSHTGVRLNSYEQYQRWGSLCHPARTLLHYALNWSVWYGIFFWIGGHALACALFGWAGVWAVGVRTFNFEGHGKGRDLRRDGIDYNRRDFSVNQLWPGLVAGEWHNNHHLYPNGARSGFLPSQPDIPWIWIRMLASCGAITTYRDYKTEYFRDHYDPYQARVRGRSAEPTFGESAAVSIAGEPAEASPQS